MGSLSFAFGSAMGAALAWLVVRREPSRSTVVTLNGVACGLLGLFTSACGGTTTPVARVEIAFLGTAAPLTLCMSPLRAIARRGAIPSMLRQFAITLAAALVSGVSCAILGFVTIEGVRQISAREQGVEPLGFPAVTSLQLSRIPARVIHNSL